MKTLNLILAAVLFMLTSCQAQDQNDSGKPLSSITPKVSGKFKGSQPDVRFKVNKHYDEKGNVIGYDSTYSYSYFGDGPADLSAKKQEIFRDFFGRNNFLPGLFDFQGFNPALRDSTLMHFFDNNTMFEKQMEMNRKMMNEFFNHFNAVPEIQTPGKQHSPALQKTI